MTTSPPNQTVPCVLVTDAERGSALAIIRSLGRRGYRVIAGSAKGRAAGFHSRYTVRRFRYPPPELDARAYRDALLGELRDQGVNLLVPVTDSAILPLLDAREEVERLCALALPATDALHAAADKQGMLALGRQLGIAVPRSEMAHDLEQALTHARSIGWPVVLKTGRSVQTQDGQLVRSTAVAFARDEDELRSRWSTVHGAGATLVQEYCAGTGQGVELLLKDGQPLAAFQHERLREYPLRGGPSALRRSVPLEPLMFQQAVALLESLRWTGLAMVEFKVGEDGPVLIEINGRVWGSLPLAVASGMDFPARMADLFLGAPIGPELHDSYRVGHHQHSLELELKWIVSVFFRRRATDFPPFPPRREALRAAAQLLRPGWTYDVPSWRDPLPGLWLLPNLLTRYAKKRAARDSTR